MKKHSFLAGMLTMALIVGLGMSALAATGQVSFNASALTLNGTQVSAKGENYTLPNGQSVPASITYTDEKGGGTTYLPVRRISELLGVETGWDGATGSVTIKGEVKAPTTPETTAPPTSFKLPASLENYEDFKAFWALRPHEGSSAYSALMVAGIDDNAENKAKFKALWNSTSKEQRSSLMKQFLDDVRAEYPDCEYIGFVFDGSSLGASGTLGYIEVKDI